MGKITLKCYLTWSFNDQKGAFNHQMSISDYSSRLYFITLIYLWQKRSIFVTIVKIIKDYFNQSINQSINQWFTMDWFLLVTFWMCYLVDLSTIDRS